MSLPSRISSEYRLGRERRAYRIRVVAVLVVLAVLCAVLAAFAAGQGPRIQSVRADVDRLVAGPGGVVELQFSRPIAEPAAGALRIEPTAEASFAVSGASAVITFVRALDADTEYRIALDGVQALGGGPTGLAATSLTTPGIAVTTLVPGADGAPDEVVETPLDGSEPRVLLRAESVREYAVLDDTVLAVTDLDARRSALSLTAIGGVETQQFVLPEEGRLAELGVIDTVVLMSFTSAVADPLPNFDLSLMRLDLAGDATPVPVVGLDGAPISVLGWYPIPGSFEVLIAARDGQVLRYAPVTGDTPLPIGQFAQVFGVSPDGGSLLAADPFGPIRVDLATGETERLPPSPVEGLEPFAGEVQMVDAERRITKIALPDESGAFTSALALDDGTTSTLIELPGAEGAAIAEFALTPSGQYLVVVLDTGAPGERVTGPSLVIELATGDTVATLPGVEPSW